MAFHSAAVPIAEAYNSKCFTTQRK